jgi:hypothetical protein
MNWALYAVAGVLAISTLIVIAHTGKTPADPAKPGGGQAAMITIVNAAMIVVVVMAAIRLS